MTIPILIIIGLSIILLSEAIRLYTKIGEEAEKAKEFKEEPLENPEHTIVLENKEPKADETSTYNVTRLL